MFKNGWQGFSGRDSRYALLGGTMLQHYGSCTRKEGRRTRSAGSNTRALSGAHRRHFVDHDHRAFSHRFDSGSCGRVRSFEREARSRSGRASPGLHIGSGSGFDDEGRTARGPTRLDRGDGPIPSTRKASDTTRRSTRMGRCRHPFTRYRAERGLLLSLRQHL
jgi:hypothetical protein